MRSMDSKDAYLSYTSLSVYRIVYIEGIILSLV